MDWIPIDFGRLFDKVRPHPNQRRMVKVIAEGHRDKEGPHVRGNGASTQDALEDKDKDQIIYHPA